MQENPPAHPNRHALAELAGLFLKLGTTAFGGPAAHIAMMEDEVVRRRQWLTREEFLDLLGATNLIPGPNSTEMAIHIGHRRAGWTGLLVAGACFILPATLIVLTCAWAYVRFGKLPQAEGLLYGNKPVIIAVVLQALWGLGRSALKTPGLFAMGSACVVGSFAGANELLLLPAGGLLVAATRCGITKPPDPDSSGSKATGLSAFRSRVRALMPLLAFMLGLLTLTWAIRGFGWDQRWQRHFWSAEEGWRYAQWPLVQFLYHFGTWPALLAGAGGGMTFIAWRITGRGQRAGRLGLFLALLLALGPGLLVNVILKEGTSRPRPVQTQEYGGTQAFRAVGEFAAPDGGHSFPSGHASTGFYWLGLCVYLRPQRKRLALVFGALGTTQGLLMGVGRMAQGGHWASDVLWSAAAVVFTAWVLHRFFNSPVAWVTRLRNRIMAFNRDHTELTAAIPALSLTNLPPSAGGATMGGAVASAVATEFALWPMFLFFFKVGSVLFGSGYVLLAFLRADLVDRWHWLTEAQLLDAIAVGQFTPGPVFTTATFIGYLLAGTPGALLATVGIFLPAFFFVAISGPLVPRLRRSPFAGAFLDGVNVASLALMAVVTWQLGRVALTDWLTVLMAIASGVCLFRFRVNSAWLVLGGAVIGMLATRLRAWPLNLQ